MVLIIGVPAAVVLGRGGRTGGGSARRWRDQVEAFEVSAYVDGPAVPVSQASNEDVLGGVAHGVSEERRTSWRGMNVACSGRETNEQTSGA